MRRFLLNASPVDANIFVRAAENLNYGIYTGPPVDTDDKDLVGVYTDESPDRNFSSLVAEVNRLNEISRSR